MRAFLFSDQTGTKRGMVMAAAFLSLACATASATSCTSSSVTTPSPSPTVSPPPPTSTPTPGPTLTGTPIAKWGFHVEVFDESVEDWANVIPLEWRNQSPDRARYVLEIRRSDRLVETCEYYTSAFAPASEVAYRLHRKQIRVIVRIVESDAEHLIGSEVFSGSIPDDCPEQVPGIYQYVSPNTEYGDRPDMSAFEEWFFEVMQADAVEQPPTAPAPPATPLG